MPHYQNPANGSLHFLDDAKFEYLLPKECVAITDEQATAIRNTPHVLTPEDSLKKFHHQVRSALNGMNDNVSKIYEAIILGTTTATAADVLEYMTYRKALRELLKSTTPGAIPAAPADPQGI